MLRREIECSIVGKKPPKKPTYFNSDSIHFCGCCYFKKWSAYQANIREMASYYRISF